MAQQMKPRLSKRHDIINNVLWSIYGKQYSVELAMGTIKELEAMKFTKLKKLWKDIKPYVGKDVKEHVIKAVLSKHFNPMKLEDIFKSKMISNMIMEQSEKTKVKIGTN